MRDKCRAWKSASRKLHRALQKLWLGEYKSADNESLGEHLRGLVVWNVKQNKYMRQRAMNVGGFQCIGAGFYSLVFSHRRFPDVVFKYNIGNYDASQELAQLLMTVRHPSLPEYYAAYMQRGVWPKADEVDGHTHGPREGTAMVSVLEKLDSLNSVYDTYDYDCWEDDDSMACAATLLRSYGFMCTDMHSGNIMWRESNDTWVITDPSTYRTKGHTGNNGQSNRT